MFRSGLGLLTYPYIDLCTEYRRGVHDLTSWAHCFKMRGRSGSPTPCRFHVSENRHEPGMVEVGSRDVTYKLGAILGILRY